MLRFSKKTDYAIVALSHLQTTGEPASAKAIASTYNLSSQMLANVLKSLAASGVLNSKRGVTGGYTLGKDPDEIYIGQVIDIIDGPVQISDCVDLNKNCMAESCCPAKVPMMMIHQKIKNFMDNLTLSDIVNESAFRSLSVENVNHQSL